MNNFVKPPKIISNRFKDILWKVNTKEKILYLTFDDGPIPENTEWILSELEKYNAKATFFCVGENVSKYPELFKKILADGHTVGNHTYNHLNNWKTEFHSYIENIQKGNEFIKSNLFRPPYGKLGFYSMRAIKRDYQIVLWDVLSRDFDPKISPEICYHNVIKNASEGSIIVFHDNYKAVRNLYVVLPLILEFYTQKGYRFNSLFNTNPYLE